MNDNNNNDFIMVNDEDNNNNNTYNNAEEQNNNLNNESYNNDNIYQVDSRYATDRVYDINYDNTSNNNQNGFKNPYDNFNMQNDSNNYNGKEKKKKDKKQRRGNGKKVAAVVCGILICTLTGAAAGAGATIYLSKNSNLLGSANNKNITYDVPKFTSTNSSSMSVVDAVNKVTPAVVTVSTKSIVSGAFGQQEQQSGVGSGFIIDKSGSIITNYHVVQGATVVKVILSTGKEVNAKVVNYDATQDLAMVKITDSNVEIPGVAELGDSDKLQAGEEVIAIGSPLGEEFTGTVTKGIVSATNRKIKSSSSSEASIYIQTDAAINPGNSGGPLINAEGQVIGINTAKISDSEVEGIGFSIPINKAKEKISSLSKPLLKVGISYKDVTSELSKQYNLPVGVWVASVEDFSPAAKAGIQVNDVIISFDGKTIKTGSELNELKAKHKSGDVVKVVVSRNGKKVTLSLKLEESNN